MPDIDDELKKHGYDFSDKEATYRKIKTNDAKLVNLEITTVQRDILIEALACYDQKDDDGLLDHVYDDLREALDNAQYLGDSA